MKISSLYGNYLRNYKEKTIADIDRFYIILRFSLRVKRPLSKLKITLLKYKLDVISAGTKKYLWESVCISTDGNTSLKCNKSHQYFLIMPTKLHFVPRLLSSGGGVIHPPPPKSGLFYRKTSKHVTIKALFLIEKMYTGRTCAKYFLKTHCKSFAQNLII